MIDQTDLPAQVEQAANQRALTCLVCCTRSGLELAVVNPSTSSTNQTKSYCHSGSAPMQPEPATRYPRLIPRSWNALFMATVACVHFRKRLQTR